MTTLEQLKAAKASCAELSCADSETKTRALKAMASALLDAEEDILSENGKDIAAARGSIILFKFIFSST